MVHSSFYNSESIDIENWQLFDIGNSRSLGTEFLINTEIFNPENCHL